MYSNNNLNTIANDIQYQYEPLVSIIVITYNSAEYVLETLESAKAQTYKNIELIVSDDCSTDNTIIICRNWLLENKHRFLRTALITSRKNTGISANCNRGVSFANGIWLKLIAGDDLLTTNSIQTFISYLGSDSSISFVIGTSRLLINNQVSEIIEYPDAILKTLTDHNQYRYFLTHTGKIHGPTAFIKRETLLELGGYDERIPYSEDWPLWIRASNKGKRLFFIDDVVAIYRISENGIFSKTKMGINRDDKLVESVNLIRKLYLIPNLLREGLYFEAFHTWIIFKKETATTRLFRILYKSLLLMDPIFYSEYLITKSK